MLRIRVTGLCFNDINEILILEQKVNSRSYALPGGGVEQGETIEAALRREFQEEVNLEVTVGKVVYITEYDRTDGVHVVEIALTVRPTGGSLVVSQLDSTPISSSFYAPVDKLGDYLDNEAILSAVRGAQASHGNYLGLREA